LLLVVIARYSPLHSLTTSTPLILYSPFSLPPSLPLPLHRYAATIGHLEPSYVIQRFLDVQRIHGLTDYLERLHAQVSCVCTYHAVKEEGGGEDMMLVVCLLC
jgi:hypothetical protein